jgi:hypothetical protein
MKTIERTQETHEVTQQIFTPSNWSEIIKIKCGNTPISRQRATTHLLKRFLHCCYTAQYLRDDGAPFSFHAAAAICKGDKIKFSKLRKTLLDNQIIKCDGLCVFREKAYHYALGPAMEEVKWKLSEKPETFTLLRPLNAPKGGPLDLTIDTSLLDPAIEYVKGLRNWTDTESEFWKWHLTENWTNESHTATTGRVYGPWSNIPRELRGLLLIKGQSTVEVDIRSAQPMLLVKLYKDRNSKERMAFMEVIESGEFYESIMRVTGESDREEIKKQVMTFLCGKKKGNPNIYSFFKKQFPEMLAEIEKITQPHHRMLGRLLQRFESDIIVRNICKNHPVYSMHDGAICEASLAPEVKKATEEAILEYCEIRAKVTIEDKRSILESASKNAVSDKAA